jgi:hypothetical protein
MDILYLVLLIISALCFVVAAFYAPTVVNTTSPPHPVTRVNLVALGLLAWVLVPLIQTIDSLS